jgi:hypothetical protein
MKKLMFYCAVFFTILSPPVMMFIHRWVELHYLWATQGDYGIVLKIWFISLEALMWYGCLYWYQIIEDE